MPEHVITIQGDQADADKTWDDLIPLGLTTSLYHLLHQKGVITTEEMQAIVDKEIQKFSDEMDKTFANDPETGKRHLGRIRGYLDSFMRDYK